MFKTPHMDIVFNLITMNNQQWQYYVQLRACYTLVSPGKHQAPVPPSE